MCTYVTTYDTRDCNFLSMRVCVFTTSVVKKKMVGGRLGAKKKLAKNVESERKYCDQMSLSIIYQRSFLFYHCHSHRFQTVCTVLPKRLYAIEQATKLYDCEDLWMGISHYFCVCCCCCCTNVYGDTWPSIYFVVPSIAYTFMLYRR